MTRPYRDGDDRSSDAPDVTAYIAMRDTAVVPSGTTPLSENAHTASGWDVIDTAPTSARGVSVGSCFLVGNGYLGYRGTRPDQRADDFVACIVSDTYDMADGVWRELCTVPNGLLVEFEIDGGPLRIDESRPAEIELTLETGEVTHRWFATTPAGATALMSMRRFASLGDLHIVAQQVSVITDAAGEIAVVAGIDDAIWSLNGEHFASVDTANLPDAAPPADGAVTVSRCVTGERGTEIAVSAAVAVEGLGVTPHPLSSPGRGVTGHRWHGAVQGGHAVTVTSTMAVATSNDDDVAGDPVTTAVAAARRVAGVGYRRTLAASVEHWSAFWSTSDVRIDGDLAAQAAMRFSTYHHRIAIPAHSDRLPIGARGLSCQAYQGAAFWDQEMFSLPALLFTEPDIARRLLVYRWRTLDGARRKARRLGYEGAFYAWISGDTGDELCPDFFFVDVLTGRPIRTHFNVWQIHISPDIAHAVWNYFDATGDVGFLADHGAEIVFEVARFLRSRVRFDEVRGRYELIRLLGPDEWHENVDNNTYTARLAKLALRHAATIRTVLTTSRPDRLAALCERLELEDQEFDAWERIEARLFEHTPDPESLLIEPFDGFSSLEDCRPADLRSRLLDPGEYWGWPNGVAVHTQVSKQPDVVQLFAVDPTYPLEVQRANYDHYEPRCSHGSSLSHSVHATVAARLAGFDPAYLAQAYEYFMDTAALDLRTAAHSVVGGTFIGGMHTAANAGAYQTAVYGFGGFSANDRVVTIAPALPPGWTSLAYDVVVRRQRLTIEIERPDGEQVLTIVTAAPDNTDAVPVRIGVASATRLVDPGCRLEG
jgi:1,2-alpha-glucosylglycerol phosphorylase